jgi:hypothetical protein
VIHVLGRVVRDLCPTLYIYAILYKDFAYESMNRDPHFQHTFFASSAKTVEMTSNIAETYTKKETILLVHITQYNKNKFNVNNLVNETNLVHNLFLL